MGMALWYTLCDHHADVLPFIQPLVGPCLFTGRGALRTSVPACHCQDECLQYGLGHYDAVDRWSLGKYDLVVRFLRGARRLNPPRSPLVPSWDLSVVLAGLQRDPFEPLESVELKYLSIKTVLLIALTFIKRVRDLQAFSVSEEFLVFGPAYSTLSRETPAWIHSQGSQHSLPRPGGEPASQQKGKAVSKQRLAHWIVDAFLLPFFSQRWLGLPSKPLMSSQHNVSVTSIRERGLRT